MNHFRLDRILVDIFVRSGPVWMVAAILILLSLVLLRVHRAMGVGIGFLLFLQVWIKPLYFMCSRMRWVVIAILAVRGLFLVFSTSAPASETRSSHVVLGMLAMWAVLSTLWSDVPVFTLLVAGTFVAGLVVSFLLTWRMADSIDVIGFLCRWAVLVCVGFYGASFVTAGWAYATDEMWILWRTGATTNRFSGVFGNPNASGVLGALLFPFVFAAPREVLGKLNKLRPLAVVLIVSAVLLSGSRSAFIGLLMAVAVVLLYRFRAGVVLFASTVLMMTLALGILTPLEDVETLDFGAMERIVRVGTLKDLGDRVQLWERGLEAGRESPWIGLGWSRSRILDNRSVAGALAAGRVHSGTNLHSAHLQIWVDLGFVGLALFWMFGLQVAAAAFRIMFAPASRQGALVMVLVASLVVMWGDSFVHGWIFSFGSPGALVFWMSCALVIKESDRLRRAAAAAAATQASASLPPPTRPAALPRPVGA